MALYLSISNPSSDKSQLTSVILQSVNGLDFRIWVSNVQHRVGLSENGLHEVVDSILFDENVILLVGSQVDFASLPLFKCTEYIRDLYLHVKHMRALPCKMLADLFSTYTYDEINKFALGIPKRHRLQVFKVEKGELVSCKTRV